MRATAIELIIHYIIHYIVPCAMIDMSALSCSPVLHSFSAKYIQFRAHAVNIKSIAHFTTQRAHHDDGRRGIHSSAAHSSNQLTWHLAQTSPSRRLANRLSARFRIIYSYIYIQIYTTAYWSESRGINNVISTTDGGVRVYNIV